MSLWGLVRHLADGSRRQPETLGDLEMLGDLVGCQARREGGPHRFALASCIAKVVLQPLEGLSCRVGHGTRPLSDRLERLAAASNSGRFPLPVSIRRRNSSMI
jgi:hypothetical protein